ncbi:MAG: hypothetical protein A3C62_02715 [Candidatus Zambryskibacteria bacterium RIFCSPHIGHO2_02_FULL_39_16]|uniref:Uncharacterized protein n=1 Tax=Candidatus Zambryskibacteria bacterium RIFCSPLOWO2_02_FULL_39_14 TaxID=1802769 RepID=A0A1G2UI39_9BACT|nr:MAG: hypothetical protein A3C62_02715 [Candidatus Zambryskibacteria bacterium RIFCSPHIGHO2_02_FULL_39_16]OHB09096.1 MAG: hypothetical protein A3I86_02795 [Candidatus Zambryskibacteria bacterium RIFCSPLOWO2_02_FULL_39_14]
MDLISSRFILIAILFLTVFGYSIFNFMVVYHLTRFGIGVQPKRFAAIFFLGSIFLFLISITLLMKINFSSLENVFPNFQISNFNINNYIK